MGIYTNILSRLLSMSLALVSIGCDQTSSQPGDLRFAWTELGLTYDSSGSFHTMSGAGLEVIAVNQTKDTVEFSCWDTRTPSFYLVSPVRFLRFYESDTVRLYGWISDSLDCSKAPGDTLRYWLQLDQQIGIFMGNGWPERALRDSAHLWLPEAELWYRMKIDGELREGPIGKHAGFRVEKEVICPEDVW